MDWACSVVRCMKATAIAAPPTRPGGGLSACARQGRSTREHLNQQGGEPLPKRDVMFMSCLPPFWGLPTNVSYASPYMCLRVYVFMCGVFIRGAFLAGSIWAGKSAKRRRGQQLVDPTAWRTRKIKVGEATNHANHTKMLQSQLYFCAPLLLETQLQWGFVRGARSWKPPNYLDFR